LGLLEFEYVAQWWSGHFLIKQNLLQLQNQ
jgi:hypothetical protein